MTGSLNWLGHDDLCSIQWSDYCDCGPKVTAVDDPANAEEVDES